MKPLSNLLWILAALTSLSLSAQTVTWYWQAQGQLEGYCTLGDPNSAWYWPSNNNWSQAQALGNPCPTGPARVVAPSNWSTTNAPTSPSNDVIIGNMGGGPANLDLPVTINSLTFQAGGGLNIQYGTRMSANTYNFESDGAITIGGGGGPDPALSLFSGGTITKSGGTNTFTMDPGLVASMTNATITVASGTLALPGGSSFYTGGGLFNVTNGATLNLVPAGQNPSFSGTFTAGGGGTVLFNAGNLYAGPGGLTFNAPDSMFQWSGGNFAVYASNPFTNAGTIHLSGGNVWGGNFWNAGTMVQSGGGGLNVQGGSVINTLSSGIFDLRNDAPITANGGSGPVPVINSYGLFRKSTGTNVSVVYPNLKCFNGTIEVDTGTLMVTGSGNNICSNTTLIVSNAATLDVTGRNNSTWSGLINGYGSGQVLLAGGNLYVGAEGLTLNLPGSMFHWTGGDFQVSDDLTAPFTNIAAMTISGGRVVGGSFFNAGTVAQDGGGGLTIHGSLNNLASGLFDLHNDAPITTDVGGTINNYGLFRKSAGTNSAIELTYFNNLGGTIEVVSGTLALTSGTSSNATLIVSNSATLDITGGVNPVWSGLINGTGAGEVVLGNSGTLVAGTGGLVLNLPGSIFQWAGGSLDSSQNPFTNSGSMTVSGANAIGVNFWNQGTMVQAGTNGLNIQAGSGMDNLSGGVFDLQNDAAVTANGGGGQAPFVINYGLFRKSAGTSNSIITPNFDNQSGTIEVDSGTLTLNNGTSSNATLVVSNTATLDLTGGANPTWSGLITGQGAGQVLLQSGTLYSGAGGLTVNLPTSLFQWVGGTIQVWSGAPFTNVGTMNVSGGTVYGGSFYNRGIIVQSGGGGLSVHNGAVVNNLIGGVFDLQNDAAITASGNGVGIINYGLFRKSGGTSNSIVYPYFNNVGGTLEVDSGTLTLAGNGTTSNATLIVKSGAVLDITGGSQPGWAGQVTGSGAGQVLLEGGILYAGAGGLTMNLPGSMFQWTGGQIWVSDSTVAPFTNAGTMTVSGGVVQYGSFFNSGTMLLVGTNGLDVRGAINNLPGALFDLQSDTVITDGSINNYGLLRKSAGTNVSVIHNINNLNGDIEIDTGTIYAADCCPGNYVQGSGTFIVKLSGTNSGQFGQLQCNNAALSGPLNVSISGNFKPALGNQFTILSSSGLSGTFSSLNVPQGISVVYTNNNVVLVVTSVRTQILNPAIANGNFVFSFETVSGQSYTIQRNDDLTTTNWVFYTNLTGNGASMEISAPATNIKHRFFRVSQP